MSSDNDILGTFALTQKLDEFRDLLLGIIDSNDPFIDLVTEAEFSTRLNIPASTLRGWRNDPVLKGAWVKKGKHIFWSPKKFRKSLENAQC